MSAEKELNTYYQIGTNPGNSKWKIWIFENIDEYMNYLELLQTEIIKINNNNYSDSYQHVTNAFHKGNNMIFLTKMYIKQNTQQNIISIINYCRNLSSNKVDELKNTLSEYGFKYKSIKSRIEIHYIKEQLIFNENTYHATRVPPPVQLNEHFPNTLRANPISRHKPFNKAWCASDDESEVEYKSELATKIEDINEFLSSLKKIKCNDNSTEYDDLIEKKETLLEGYKTDFVIEKTKIKKEYLVSKIENQRIIVEKIESTLDSERTTLVLLQSELDVLE
jgi:hypothetical protein